MRFFYSQNISKTLQKHDAKHYRKLLKTREKLRNMRTYTKQAKLYETWENKKKPVLIPKMGAKQYKTIRPVTVQQCLKLFKEST